MAHGREGTTRPPGPEGVLRAPDRGPGPALLRATGPGPAPLDHEPWTDELNDKANNWPKVISPIQIKN